MNGDAPPSNSDELRRLKLQQAHELGLENVRVELTKYQVNTQRMLEQTRAGNEAGTEAIKAVTLINGGAAVAVLAFVGHLASIHATSTTIMNFVRPLDLFVWGVFAGAVASGVVYVTHVCYFNAINHEFAAKTARDDNKPDLAKLEEEAKTWWNQAGKRIANPVAVLTGVASLCLFVAGCLQARHAFESRIITSLTEDHPTSSSGLFY